MQVSAPKIITLDNHEQGRSREVGFWSSAADAPVFFVLRKDAQAWTLTPVDAWYNFRAAALPREPSAGAGPSEEEQQRRLERIAKVVRAPEEPKAAAKSGRGQRRGGVLDEEGDGGGGGEEDLGGRGYDGDEGGAGQWVMGAQEEEVVGTGEDGDIMGFKVEVRCRYGS